MTKGHQPVAWMYDFLNPDNRDEVIRDWVTQNYNDIEREVGFNVRPLYTTPPAAQPAPVPMTFERLSRGMEILAWNRSQAKPPIEITKEQWVANELERFYTTPPTPQPVPVKTYHDGKPWPVAPKPWVGLDEDEVEDCARGCANHAELARAIEAKLKEKNQ